MNPFILLLLWRIRIDSYLALYYYYYYYPDMLLRVIIVNIGQVLPTYLSTSYLPTYKSIIPTPFHTLPSLLLSPQARP